MGGGGGRKKDRGGGIFNFSEEVHMCFSKEGGGPQGVGGRGQETLMDSHMKGMGALIENFELNP